MTDKPNTVDKMSNQEFLAQMREELLWMNIQRTARIDPGLRELLEPAIMYYKLKYDHR
jgi:hypothetical protein